MRAVALRVVALTAMTLAAAPAAQAAQISIGDSSVSEGDVGTTAAGFDVTLDAPAAGTVTVDYKTQDNGSASANADYDIKQGTVSFAPGETKKTITIDVRGDKAVEGDETYDVRLSNASGATIADGTGVGTIVDDDTNAPESFASINDVSVTEGDSGITKATMTVSLDHPASRVLEYDVSTTNGQNRMTALPNVDFYANHQRVVFGIGEKTKTFQVDVIGDTIDEQDEYVVVLLTRVGYDPGRIADGEGVLYILDDDPKAAAVAGASASRQCLSRRNFTIRVRDHLYAKRNQVAQVVVMVDGKRVRSHFGRRITAFVDFRRKPKKTANVDVALVLDDGTVIKRQRRYRLCDPRKLDDGIPPEL